MTPQIQQNQKYNQSDGSSADYSAILQSFMALYGEVTIQTIGPTGVPIDLLKVGGPQVVHDLVINTAALRQAVDLCPLQIGYWGRIVAVTKRVVAVRERHLRQWKAKMHLHLHDKHKQDGLKRPTEAEVETYYRTHADYDAKESALEAAIEAMLTAEAVYQGFRAKKDLLNIDVRRVADGTMQRNTP